MMEEKTFKKIGKDFKVAICGRPNVGKSTLFNRLISQRKAIVSHKAGTTRDRIYGRVDYNNKSFVLIDTGGLMIDKDDEILEEVKKQIKTAVLEADLILFVVEISGLTKEDLFALDFLRKNFKKIILVVNKTDHREMIKKASSEFFSFGDLDGPVFISAIHKLGIEELLEKIINYIPDNFVFKDIPEEEKIKVAFCGRPNVGKSSLLNKIIGEERAIVSEKPGTTRDVVDVEIDIQGRRVIFIDTAGVRRRGKIKWGEEKFSVIRSLQAIERADIAVLLIDAKEGIVKQDLHIAEHALKTYSGVILAVNKWDLVEKEKSQEEYINYLRNKISFLPWAPVVFISALQGKNINKLLELIFQINEERRKRVRIKELNKIIKEAILKHPPSRISSQKPFPKIFYVTQAEGVPPTFVFMTSFSDNLHFSYKRYLENVIRENFGFWGTAIKMIFKEKKGEKK